MSIKLMSLVWDNFPRGGSEKLVMLAMADWANDSGSHCYPSIRKVAEKCNVSECQARRLLHKLIDDGYLSVVGNASGGGNKPRQYQVNVSSLGPSTHASPITGASPSTHARVALAPMHVSPSTHASLSVNNHQLSVKKAKPSSAQQVTEYAQSISFNIDGQAFMDFYEARGWKLNKGLPMKDWKAAVRTWKRRQIKETPQVKYRA